MLQLLDMDGNLTHIINHLKLGQISYYLKQ